MLSHRTKRPEIWRCCQPATHVTHRQTYRNAAAALPAPNAAAEPPRPPARHPLRPCASCPWPLPTGGLPVAGCAAAGGAAACHHALRLRFNRCAVTCRTPVLAAVKQMRESEIVGGTGTGIGLRASLWASEKGDAGHRMGLIGLRLNYKNRLRCLVK